VILRKNHLTVQFWHACAKGQATERALNKQQRTEAAFDVERRGIIMPRGHVLPDGNQIACLRGEADLTQWQLACAAGYGLRTIGKIEDSQRTGARTLSAVATVLARKLQRPIQMTDLLRRPNGSADSPWFAYTGVPCLVEEGLKVLDLAQWRPSVRSTRAVGPESRAVLLDRYRFRKVAAELSSLTFYYATLGRRIDGQCLTHAHCSEWRQLQANGSAPAAGPHLSVAYQLTVKLDRPAGPGMEVRNRLEYVNAFAGQDREWFHSHVTFPTAALTMMVLFPGHKPCRALQGLTKLHPAAPFDAAPEQPISLSDGKLAYWHIRAPQMGATYQVEWEW
jgi:hypothetical protein